MLVRPFMGFALPEIASSLGVLDVNGASTSEGIFLYKFLTLELITGFDSKFRK